MSTELEQTLVGIVESMILHPGQSVDYDFTLTMRDDDITSVVHPVVVASTRVIYRLIDQLATASGTSPTDIVAHLREHIITDDLGEFDQIIGRLLEDD